MPPPLELNDAVAEAICTEVENGLPVALAAPLAGFTRQAVDKWQRQGRADLEAGAEVAVTGGGRVVGGTPQARFVVRLERARARLAAPIVTKVVEGATGKPFEVDWRAATAALETLMPAHFGKRALEVQALREEAAAQADAPTEGKAAAGAVAVELTRCPACGRGTATDEGRAAWCAGCGQRLPEAG